jgi:hypothetical protein
MHSPIQQSNSTHLRGLQRIGLMSQDNLRVWVGRPRKVTPMLLLDLQVLSSIGWVAPFLAWPKVHKAQLWKTESTKVNSIILTHSHDLLSSDGHCLV